MQIYKIQATNPQKIFDHIGCDKAGAKIMAKKSGTNMLYIKQIVCGAVNILKQEAISVGADVATPKGAVVCDKQFYDVVLMGSDRQLEILSTKLKAQPFGLKELASKLTQHKTTKPRRTKIMGVLNINDDSFYDKSQTTLHEAIEQIETMITQKADIVDIGAVSSRPGSTKVSAQEEWHRVHSLITQIYEQKLYDKIALSIDSYDPAVVRYALECGFEIVNDITGLRDDNIAQLIAKHDATAVIMHMKGTPQTMQDNLVYDDVILDIDQFFTARIASAEKFGIKDIVLDVGIGFGKTSTQNLTLLKHLEHFEKFGRELLVGVSRKSIINDISPSDVHDRLPGTIALNIKAVQNGASIIRCHDVKEHRQAIDMLEAMEDIAI